MKFLLQVVFLCLTFVVTGQEMRPIDSLRFEAGFVVSPILEKIFSPQSTLNIGDEPAVFFNVKLGKKLYWRNGFGISYTDADSDNQNQANSTTSFSRMSFRTGLESRVTLGKRFQMHYGLDAIYNYQRNEFRSFFFNVDGTTDTFISTQKIQGYGASPLLGFTWWMTDRIGLWIESAADFTSSDEESRSTFEGINQVDDVVRTSKLFNIQGKLPTTILIKFKF